MKTHFGLALRLTRVLDLREQWESAQTEEVKGILSSTLVMEEWMFNEDEAARSKNGIPNTGVSDFVPF